MKRVWTIEESEIVKKLYPTSLKSQMLSLLPNHSWQQIRWKANSFGLTAKRIEVRKGRDELGRFTTRNNARKKRKRIIVKCAICGTEFNISPSRLQKRNAFYCSVKCRGIAYQGEGNPFWGKKHTNEVVQRLRDINKGKSHEGRPPLRYRIIEEEEQPFSMTFTAKSSIKNLIKHCEKCGYKDDPRILVLHHKDGNHKHNHSDNLIILCHNCHALAHLELLDASTGVKGSNVILPPHIGFRRKHNE